jgi:hypothetical protein
MHLIEKTMDNKHKRWEKSETADGITKRVCVEQVENGFVITMEKYGSGSDEKYTSECKKYISKKNPLEGENPKTEEESASESRISLALSYNTKKEVWINAAQKGGEGTFSDKEISEIMASSEKKFKEFYKEIMDKIEKIKK